ncbi:MAG: NAD(P)/FAD-dependent oxidoreductase [Alphaproteobacteria bacterium]|nr:NAD(P)/FAD-dependent oxidoreductase [Alphaproteobacteria bacterium]
MPLDTILQHTTAADVTAKWLADFEHAVARGDAKAARDLFIDDSHWRDLLAFTWHIDTRNGADAIEALLARSLPHMRPSNFEIAPGRTPPQAVERAGVATIESIFNFETAVGRGSGVLRLVPSPEFPDELRAWVLLTALDEIKGHEERINRYRPTGKEFSGGFGAENWLDQRNRQRAYEDHEPTVLVVGGGQAGLGIGACLGRLDVDTLVIDRHERVGDAWRKRYHNLVLHNEVFVNHLPYMPYPPNWPVYIPKDLLANFFEAYADAMELNFWTSTEIVSGSYDDATGQWSVKLIRDGKERTVKPRHIVFATGVSSIPIRPNFPGLENFKGTVMHSGDYQNGHEWKGKKAVVFGTGNSGHDVAHDLHNSGADTTIVQRDTTLIVSLKEAQRIYTLYQGDTPLEDCDLLASASPYPVLVRNYQMVAAKNAEEDRELLDGLRKRGFKLDNGPPDNTGYQMKYLRRGGGYCFNVGCSDLIVEGKIKLEHFENIDHFIENGARMTDGSIMEADLIVTATGYKNQQEVARLFLGDEVADRIGPVWGFGDDGEQRNMWRRTAQPGLWFTGGGLPHVRIYSKYLAMQIKAIEEGIITNELPVSGESAGHPVDTDSRKELENT